MQNGEGNIRINGDKSLKKTKKSFAGSLWVNTQWFRRADPGSDRVDK